MAAADDLIWNPDDHSKAVELFNGQPTTEDQEWSENARRSEASGTGYKSRAVDDDDEDEEERDECVVKTAMIEVLRSQQLKAKGEIRRLKAASQDATRSAVHIGELEKAQQDTKPQATLIKKPVVNNEQAKEDAENNLAALQKALEQALTDRDKAALRADAAEEALAQANLDIATHRLVGTTISTTPHASGIQDGQPPGLEDLSAKPSLPTMQVLDKESEEETNRFDLNTDVISERAAQAMSDAANITHTCVLQPENNAFEKDVVYAEIARAAEILAAKEIWGVAETAESVAAELRKLIEARLLFL
jgi:hypothetical protein